MVANRVLDEFEAIAKVTDENKVVEIVILLLRHPHRSVGRFVVGNDLITMALFVAFSKIDLAFVMRPHHHVGTVPVGSVDIRERGVVTIGKQDFARKKQVDDRLQQTVLAGLFATITGHRNLWRRAGGKAKQRHTSHDRKAASLFLAALLRILFLILDGVRHRQGCAIRFWFRMFHPPCVEAGHGVSAGMIGR